MGEGGGGGGGGSGGWARGWPAATWGPLHQGLLRLPASAAYPCLSCFLGAGGGFGAPSSVGFSRDLRQCPLLTAPAPHCAFRSLIFFASAGHSGLGLALTSGDSIQQDSKQVPVCRPSVWPQSGGVTVYTRCAIPTCVRSLILERARDLTLLASLTKQVGAWILVSAAMKGTTRTPRHWRIRNARPGRLCYLGVEDTSHLPSEGKYIL